MPLTKEDAYLRITAYCAYRERSLKEVHNKLYGLGLNKDIIEEIIEKLLHEKFVDESRFSRIYATSRFNGNKWGKLKIIMGLRQKGICEEDIENALKEIDEEEYQNLMKELARKKAQSIKEKDSFVRNRKISAYLIQKGFEPDDVWKVVRSLEE